MKIIKNEKLIKRNRTIGNWASLLGIVLVFIPAYFYFQSVLQGNTTIPNITWLLVLAIVGIAVSQVGMYMGIRYGRSPRPDEKLDTGLKGLPNDFVIYHYTTPVSHLLVGPAGVWVIRPFHQPGNVSFKKKRWRLSGGGFFQAYMRFFGQEGLGRPDVEIEGEIDSLKRSLSKKMGESEIPNINALIVFTNDGVEIDAEDSPIPALKLKQLKDFVRQKAKEKKLPAESINKVKTALE